jgi:hypothetical protein
MNEEIAHRFAYHPPRDEATVKAHERVRELLGAAAQELDALLPADRPRERALTQTKLEEAMMHANAAIARSKLGVADG